MSTTENQKAIFENRIEIYEDEHALVKKDPYSNYGANFTPTLYVKWGSAPYVQVDLDGEADRRSTPGEVWQGLAGQYPLPHLPDATTLHDEVDQYLIPLFEQINENTEIHFICSDFRGSTIDTDRARDLLQKVATALQNLSEVDEEVVTQSVEIQISGKIWTGTLSNPVMSGDGRKVGFDFELLTPVQAKAQYYFPINRFPEIRLHKSCALAAALLNHVGGTDNWVEFAIPTDKLAELVKVIAETHAEYVAEQGATVITAWHWAIGGDSHRLFVRPTLSVEREDIKEINRFCETQRDLPLREKSRKIYLKAGMYTEDGWYEISDADLQTIIAARKAEIAAEEEAREEAKRAKFNAALQKAKDTNGPAQLRQWSEDCDDPKEECSMDICTEYVYPDGSTKITRNHTW